MLSFYKSYCWSIVSSAEYISSSKITHLPNCSVCYILETQINVSIISTETPIFAYPVAFITPTLAVTKPQFCIAMWDYLNICSNYPTSLSCMGEHVECMGTHYPYMVYILKSHARVPLMT